MLIEQTKLKGIKSELAHLDDVSSALGFDRWQWEYYRATYDYRIDHSGMDYYLRINTRAIEGKLESPHAVLQIEDIYLGKATFPHGLDYQSELPDSVIKEANRVLEDLLKNLA